MQATDAHTVKSFDEELSALDRNILEMSGIAEANLSAAIDALIKRDVEASAQIIEADERVDEYEQEIEAGVLRLLALRQPMANDLRYVLGSLKISGSLERIGDYAKNIAKRTIVLAEYSNIAFPQDVARLADLAIERLKDTIDAFANRDIAKANAVWERDQQIDDLYARVMRNIISEMSGDKKAIECGAHFLFIGKNLERVGDHATNIAEVLEFQMSGSWRTEDRPKGNDGLNVVTQ